MCAIEQILHCVPDNVQVLIQDNSDEPTLQAFCVACDTSRLKYHYQARTLSFVDNFGEAVSLADGEYICMIGDDDGVLPSIEAVAVYAKEKNLDAFIPGLNAVYFWPTTTPVVPHAESGYLYLTPMSGHIKKVSQDVAVEKLLSQSFQDYQQTNVARLYHGLVHYSVLEEIRQQTGHYFGGLTPDMYMSVALGLVCKNVEYANFPITISGICPGSGSSNSATGAHTGELRDAPHFIGHESYEWNPLIPCFYSVETIWAETALQALEEMGAKEHISRFNLIYFLSVLWEKYPQFRERIASHAEEHGIRSVAIKKGVVSRKAKYLFVRGIKLITGYRLRSERIYGVPNIKIAEEQINKKCAKIEVNRRML